MNLDEFKLEVMANMPFYCYNEENEDCADCFVKGAVYAYNKMNEEIEQLKDELDGLYMRYLSQVSLWKSRYEELKNKTDETKV